jgi:hypothetical protein
MDELANPIGPRKELVNNHCLEFMQLIKVLLFLSTKFISVIVYNVQICMLVIGIDYILTGTLVLVLLLANGF